MYVCTYLARIVDPSHYGHSNRSTCRWEEFPCPYEDKPKILSVFAAARSEISSHETIRPARLELC